MIPLTHTTTSPPVEWTYDTVTNFGGGVQPSMKRCMSEEGGGVGNLINCSSFYAESDSDSSPAEASAGAQPDFNLGTGWGNEVKDEVTLRDFKRGTELATMSVYYTDAKGLKAVGIDVSKTVAVEKPTLPSGFHGFCTPPKVTS